MIYILIVLWGSSHKAALAVEFNDLQSCRAAAKEIGVQYQERHGNYPSIIFCAQKGKP